MRELAIEVLGEVPDQFVDYMIMMENDSDKIYNPHPDKEKKQKQIGWEEKGTLSDGDPNTKEIEQGAAKKVSYNTEA